MQRRHEFSVYILCALVFVTCVQGQDARKVDPQATQLMLQALDEANAKSQREGRPVEPDLKRIAQLIEDGADVNWKHPQTGVTLLHYLCISKFTGCAKLLIAQGASVKAKTTDGDTPLHMALVFGANKAVPDMVKAGADVNAANKQGATPLLIAAHFGDKENAKLLISNGAKQTIFSACAMGDLKAVKKFVSDGADVNAFVWTLTTPIHEAAINGHTEVAKFLVSKGAKVDVKEVEKHTPLHWAATTDDVELCKLLIDNGATIDAICDHKQTPLFEAAMTGSLKVARLLIDRGAKVKTTGDFGQSTLHAAVENNHPEMVKLLIAHGADVNVQQDQGGAPIHAAVFDNRPKMVKLLIDHKANVNVSGKDIATPLHMAAVFGHIEVLKMLIEAKADVNAAPGRFGSPLYLAMNEKNKEVIEILQKHGAKRIEPKPQVPHGVPDIGMTVPKGWTKSNPSNPLINASFAAGEGDQRVKVTIVSLPLSAGQALANVNRWRAQIGLGPMKKIDQDKDVEFIEVAGKPGALFDLYQKDNKNPKPNRIMVVMHLRGERVWFVKMAGTIGAVELQREAFRRFVGSLNFK